MSARYSPDPRAKEAVPPARPGTPSDDRRTSGLLERLGLREVDPMSETAHRVAEVEFVGDLLVDRIDPILRLSPRARREAGESAWSVGASVRYAHLRALDAIADLYAAEACAGDFVRWLTAVGGVGVHRYLRWFDERAHFEDTSAWARELRTEYGSLLGDLYEVSLHDDQSILGSVALRLGHPSPRPTRSLWEIA